MSDTIADTGGAPVSKQVMLDDLSQFLTFHAGGELLGICILDVQEIIEVSVMTRVPMTPDFIKGVINLRGSVVPVVDLASRLERGPSDISKHSCIVLVEVRVDEDAQTIGMLVDEVNEILEIPDENMQPAPDFGADIRADFIQRMGRVDNSFVILLEVNRVLSVEELSEFVAMHRGKHNVVDSEVVVEQQ